jgi:hypothetical protein
VTGRTTEQLRRDLEHEEKNLEERLRELGNARQVVASLAWQCDNVERSIKELTAELELRNQAGTK